MPEYHQIIAIGQRLAPECPPEAMAGACRAVQHKLSGNPASDAEIEAALIAEIGAASPHVAPPATPPPAEPAPNADPIEPATEPPAT